MNMISDYSELSNPFTDKKNDKRVENFLNEMNEYDSEVFNNDQNIDIFLTKNNEKKFKEYDDKYDKALFDILDFLFSLGYKPEYKNKINGEYTPMITIYVSNNITSEEKGRLWEEIFVEVGTFAEKNGIEFILDELHIVLEREK